MDEKSIQRLSRNKCIGKIKGIDQHGPRTLEDMNMKRCKFSLYTKLNERLKLKCKGKTILNVVSLNVVVPSEVPGIRAKWSSDEKFYPYIDNNISNKYCLFKHQENKGQQEKAIRILQRRKIVYCQNYT